MDHDRDSLSFRPIPAAIQRVAVYETRTWLYVVGSTNDGTSCCLLKVDRTLPSPSSPKLVVEELGVGYSEAEIKDLLIMLDDGNKHSGNKHKAHGLKQVASAFGIIGFIRFLEGYYVVLITKRKPVATIGGHVIYKIEDTVTYPISNTNSKPSHPDEAKYLKIFQNVDLSSNFYFSYSYDLTLSLQCQMRTSTGRTPPSCSKFVWNDHMLRGIEGFVHPKWVLHIMHGFVGQYNISVYGKPIYLTMVARRSREFAGTRFLKRGANDEGHVANEVETEQIVHDATSCLHTQGKYSSYLQLRGSVPSFWSQDMSGITGIRPRPQIIIDRASPFASPAALHFIDCLRRFGSPVICLNLVKKKERRARESLLTEELQSSIEYLNQFLPPEHHIQYIHKDMARINRSKSVNLIDILEKIANEAVKTTGFFHNGPELYCNKLHPYPEYKAIGGYGYRDDYIGRDQTGVLRVNCVDCLDRTNTAQFIVGKCALGYQLYALGVLSDPKLPFDCEAIRILEEVYEDLGDTLAVQYGGSHLVHRIQTYRKVAPMANHGRDIYQTIHRYYRNAFTDVDKQMAINVFLGVFQPHEGSPNIWELSTDYYLHHTLARTLPATQSSYSHTKWWNEKTLSSLPLPYNQVANVEEEKEEEEEGSPTMVEEKTDSFHEVYKPFELTDFDGLLSRSIGRTPDDTSPFVVRAKPKKKLPRVPSRPAIVGSPSPPEGEQDSQSSGESSSEEESQTSLPSIGSQSLGSSACSPNPAEVTTMEAYGFEVQEPSPADTQLYEWCAGMHASACMPGLGGAVELTSEGVNNELARWEPTYDYKEDDVFSIEPPVVSPEDERIYEQAAARMATYTKGFLSVPPASLQLYSQYVKMTCR